MNSPLWTAAEEDFLRKYAGSLHWTSLGRALGRTEASIRARLFKLQIPYLPQSKPETIDVADVEGEAPPRRIMAERTMAERDQKLRPKSRPLSDYYRPQGFLAKPHGAECSNPDCTARVSFVHGQTGECLKCAVRSGTFEEEPSSPERVVGAKSTVPKMSDETIQERIRLAHRMRDDLEVCGVDNAMIHMHPAFAEFSGRQPEEAMA